MAGKTRDYAAEYARRKARGLASGLTLPQARGHARYGELHASDLKVDTAKRSNWLLKTVKRSNDPKLVELYKAAKREKFGSSKGDTFGELLEAVQEYLDDDFTIGTS